MGPFAWRELELGIKWIKPCRERTGEERWGWSVCGLVRIAAHTGRRDIVFASLVLSLAR